MPNPPKRSAMEVYNDLQRRWGVQPPEPTSPLLLVGENSLAFLLHSCGLRTWQEVANMLPCSPGEAERLGKLSLGRTVLTEADEASCRKLMAVARQRVAAYATVGHAISRVLDRGEAKAIADRIRGRRMKL